jgi:hypothetical protein
MAGNKRGPSSDEKTIPDGIEPPTPRYPILNRNRISTPPNLIVTDDEEISPSPLTGWPIDVHLAFQKLWTKAVGQDGYDKKEWNHFRSLLDRWLLPPGSE